MDFALSKKHEMARNLFKEFAENEAKPLAQEVDETEQFPEGTAAKMAKDDVVFAITSKALVFICWLFKSLHEDMKKKVSI